MNPEFNWPRPCEGDLLTWYVEFIEGHVNSVSDWLRPCEGDLVQSLAQVLQGVGDVVPVGKDCNF